MKYVSHDYQSCAAQLILDHPVAVIMPQVDGWVKSRERHRIPLYGLQRIYVARCRLSGDSHERIL